MGKKYNKITPTFSNELKKSLELLIKIIGQNYHRYKMIILESAINVSSVSPQKLRTAIIDKARIDQVYNSLSHYSKIIIDIDVIRKDEGASYLERMSKSQYYRYRLIAYHEFITKLG